MSWLRSIGIFEYILIGSFLLIYLFYIIRIAIIARKIKSDFNTIFYKFFIRSFYFSLLIISILGPSFGNARKEIKSVSKNIYIVSDISLSMNTTDIQPSRLERAKQELKKITNSLNSDRIGLIAFGSSAFVQCPPTHDQSALTLFIETLNSNLISEKGSNMSDGLKLAMNQHLKSPSNFNKVIILISDGEDFSEKTEIVAREIKKQNIKLIVLGIGTSQGGKIPMNGHFKKNNEGKIVISPLAREKLLKITEEAEGNYFEINEASNGTDRLINTINQIEGTISDTKEVDASANKYIYFLTIALVFIVIDILITAKALQF